MNGLMVLLKRDLKNSINKRMILLLGFMVILQSWFIFGSGSIKDVMQSGQMNFIAVVFSFNIFGPIVALALSYDSISTDRENKVMDLILTSGVSKKKVVFSKILNSMIISTVFAALYVLIILLIYLFALKDFNISLLTLRYVLPITAFLYIYNLLGLLLSIIFRSSKLALIVSVILGMLFFPKISMPIIEALTKSIGLGEKATEMFNMVLPALIMNALSGYAEKSQIILGALLFATYIVVIIALSILVFSKQDELNYSEKE